DKRYGARAPIVKEQKPPRADARRNRERVLDTADRVFAAEGMGVPTDEIARRAGVGPGTLYRHFPTKEALFMAVAVSRVKASIEEARRLAKSRDPAAALFDYLRGLGAQFEARRDLIEVMAARGQSLHEAHPELARELNAAIGTLLTNAQTAGAVRSDVTVDDVMNLVVGVFSASTQFGRGSKTAGRLLAVVFDGLRAPRSQTSAKGC
ncbi:MAG TPA: TetR/AcrR family transcriptional regulator, partial [Candidatus Dormibacteraeota bacterium]|nr:TetR/AcrR family transcriptional regulator [Candidatus Dormibacteraeota bacterium]